MEGTRCHSILCQLYSSSDRMFHLLSGILYEVPATMEHHSSYDNPRRGAQYSRYFQTKGEERRRIA